MTAVFVPNEAGFHELLDSPTGFVALDLERRLIAAVSLAKVYATGSPAPGANNPEGRGPKVRTGRLRSSLTHEIELGASGLIGRYGSNVPYAYWLETGLRNGATYPFLQPAIPALFI